MTRIAGLLSAAAGPRRPALLADMLAACGTVRPAAAHTRAAGRAALGALSASAAPLAAAEGVLVALDGHLYNRDDFGAGDDAALVAALYHRHGFADALRRLNGDFALALYDPGEDTLWLGRDRFGVRPLYYARTADGFAFASRPRALLLLPGVRPEVNRCFVALFAASHYRTFDNAPEESPYADVAQLPAAGWLCAHGGCVTSGTYWALEDAPDFSGPEDALAERYRALLVDAVARRLRVAERPAFTLSGGMDSSSVLASAVHVTGAKQDAFSTVYADRTYDESDDIRTMLADTVQHWHTIPVGTPNVFALVGRMIAAHDEPVATATWLSHFLLCEEAARRGFGGLFGGLGGDELNAGEYEHFFFHFADLRAAGAEERLAREVARWVQYHDHPIFRKSFAVVEDAFGRVVDLARPGRCLADRRRLERYAAALNRDYFDLRAFEPVMDHPFRSYLKNRTYQDLVRETVPCCLRAEDRQAAAFGLDHFLPFLDHRLVELMFRVPGTMKYRDGVTKYLLRQAMRGILPVETRTRVKKTGWNAPAHVWFSGPGRGPLLDLVHSRVFRERGIYDVAEVLRLLDEHEAIVASGEPREHHMMFLWQLVNLELWLQSAAALPRAHAA
jgi:asparagine synthase (glutamine-hydrolysing)